MNFNSYYYLEEGLNQKWVASVKYLGKYGEVFKNPSAYDIWDITKQNDDTPADRMWLRSFVSDYGKGDVYVWPGDSIEHEGDKYNSDDGSEIKKLMKEDQLSMIPVYIENKTESAGDGKNDPTINIRPSTWGYAYQDLSRDKLQQVINDLKNNKNINNLKQGDHNIKVLDWVN